MANHYRDKGALVIFEPSSMGDEKQLRKAVDLSHVVKYSHERLSSLSESLGNAFIPLEIETQGRGGLRYRWNRSPKDTTQWKFMPAYEILQPIDEAGSGDWCTAGIIDVLGHLGPRSLAEDTSSAIEQALKIGQALAAINCRFLGARGAMYNLSCGVIRRAVLGIVEGRRAEEFNELEDPISMQRFLREVCFNCQDFASR